MCNTVHQHSKHYSKWIKIQENIPNKYENISLWGSYKGRMASKCKEHPSISTDLKHQLWTSDSPSGHGDGDFEGTQKWKTLISLQPFTLGTLSLLQLCSQSVTLNNFWFLPFLTWLHKQGKSRPSFLEESLSAFPGHSAPWTSQLLIECYLRVPKYNYLLNKYINFSSTIFFPPTSIFLHLNYLILNTFQWPNSFSFSIIYVP